jgi:hypothetical protein
VVEVELAVEVVAEVVQGVIENLLVQQVVVIQLLL